MRRKASLILTSLVAFDLGTVVVSAQTAAGDYFLKINSLDRQSDYLKFDGDYRKLKLADACIANKGTLVEFMGDRYCRTAKTAIPSNPRK
jgi:hypothetical protein